MIHEKKLPAQRRQRHYVQAGGNIKRKFNLMCGICGYIGFEPDPRLLNRMTGSLVHRGPDDEGIFTGEMVGLGMRRLSIIDVAGGRQPIFNEDRSLVIVANGEIYNYLTLMDGL